MVVGHVILREGHSVYMSGNCKVRYAEPFFFTTEETTLHSLPSVCSLVGIRQEYPVSAALAALVLRCTSQNGQVVDDVWTAMFDGRGNFTQGRRKIGTTICGVHRAALLGEGFAAEHVVAQRAERLPLLANYHKVWVRTFYTVTALVCHC